MARSPARLRQGGGLDVAGSATLRMTSCIVRGNRAGYVSAPPHAAPHTPQTPPLGGVLWPHTPRSARKSRNADGETASPPRALG
eukprot:4006262-Prymnesium_polylepis.1